MRRKGLAMTRYVVGHGIWTLLMAHIIWRHPINGGAPRFSILGREQPNSVADGVFNRRLMVGRLICCRRKPNVERLPRNMLKMGGGLMWFCLRRVGSCRGAVKSRRHIGRGTMGPVLLSLSAAGVAAYKRQRAFQETRT